MHRNQGSLAGRLLVPFLLTLFPLLVVAWIVLAGLRIVWALALLLRLLILLIVLLMLLFLVSGVHLRTPFHLSKTLGKGEISQELALENVEVAWDS